MREPITLLAMFSCLTTLLVACYLSYLGRKGFLLLYDQIRAGKFNFSLRFLLIWILVIGVLMALCVNTGDFLIVQQTPKGEERFYERYGWPFISIETRKHAGPGYFTHHPEIQIAGMFGNLLFYAVGSLALLLIVKQMIVEWQLKRLSRNKQSS